MTIEKGLLGKEDVNFGTDTFQRKGQSGTLIPITSVNAAHLPIADAAGKFTGADVETALQECVVETGGGSHSADYTNKSGAQRVVGEVVVIDSSNDASFTTTTTAGLTTVLGIVGETIENNAVGKVYTGGYIATVNVVASTTRGEFLKTSTTAGKVTATAAVEVGSFAVALSSGSGSVAAMVFGVLGLNYLPLAGGNLTGTLGLLKSTVDVASASDLDPWSVGSGNYFDVTGTTNIATIATSGQIGTVLVLHFDGSLTLSHDATNLALPGGVDWVTGAGDELTFIEYATGDWRCVGYVDASMTGTVNVVRSNTPTLVTPKVDTINEATGANGVTVDGLNIKDGKLNTNDSVLTTHLTKTSTYSTAAINNSAWKPAAGVYVAVVASGGAAVVYLEVYDGAAWQRGLNQFSGGQIITDGATVRIIEVGSIAATVHYRSID